MKNVYNKIKSKVFSKNKNKQIIYNSNLKQYFKDSINVNNKIYCNTMRFKISEKIIKTSYGKCLALIIILIGFTFKYIFIKFIANKYINFYIKDKEEELKQIELEINKNNENKEYLVKKYNDIKLNLNNHKNNNKLTKLFLKVNNYKEFENEKDINEMFQSKYYLLKINYYYKLANKDLKNLDTLFNYMNYYLSKSISYNSSIDFNLIEKYLEIYCYFFNNLDDNEQKIDVFFRNSLILNNIYKILLSPDKKSKNRFNVNILNIESIKDYNNLLNSANIYLKNFYKSYNFFYNKDEVYNNALLELKNESKNNNKFYNIICKDINNKEYKFLDINKLFDKLQFEDVKDLKDNFLKSINYSTLKKYKYDNYITLLSTYNILTCFNDIFLDSNKSNFSANLDLDFLSKLSIFCIQNPEFVYFIKETDSLKYILLNSIKYIKNDKHVLNNTLLYNKMISDVYTFVNSILRISNNDNYLINKNLFNFITKILLDTNFYSTVIIALNFKHVDNIISDNSINKNIQELIIKHQNELYKHLLNYLIDNYDNASLINDERIVEEVSRLCLISNNLNYFNNDKNLTLSINNIINNKTFNKIYSNMNKF